MGDVHGGERGPVVAPLGPAPGSGHELMYGRLAPWFHLLTAPEDYAEEAAWVLELLRGRCQPLRTLLELGSGGGNLASHLVADLELTLVDRSPPMLELSRTINPGCEHVGGDMRTIRLGRTFDAVLIHDAIMYLTAADDLGAAFATVAAHLRPGGVAVLMPDAVRETFRPSTDHGGHDSPDGTGRAMRYLEWSWDPDPSDSTFVTEFAFLLREADGSVRVEQDRHLEGLFDRATWLRLLAEAGLAAELVHDAWDRDVFVARDPRPG
jgi:SAM-dependent methyltransferase